MNISLILLYRIKRRISNHLRKSALCMLSNIALLAAVSSLSQCSWGAGHQAILTSSLKKQITTLKGDKSDKV